MARLPRESGAELATRHRHSGFRLRDRIEPLRWACSLGNGGAPPRGFGFQPLTDERCKPA
jgi:hypothetical protein